MSKENKLPEALLEKARKIRVILMDVDGVMTSGMIVYDANGLEIKHFNAHDGQGIKLARLAGLKTGIISTRESGTIRTRAAELGMDYLYLGTNNKLGALRDLQQKLNLPPETFCFAGDDLPDIPVLQEVGFAVAVGNAVERVKESAHFVTERPGGAGAIREIVEIILEAQGLMEEAVQKVFRLE